MQQRDDLYIFAEINHHHVKYWAWTGKLCPNFRKHGIVFRIRHRDDDSYDICIIDGCSHHIITNKSNVKVQKELKTFIDKFYDEGIQERQLDALESIQGKLGEIQSDVQTTKYTDVLSRMSQQIAEISNRFEQHSEAIKDSYGKPTGKKVFNVHEAM